MGLNNEGFHNINSKLRIVNNKFSPILNNKCFPNAFRDEAEHSDMDLLMERLRSRSRVYKSFREYSKSIRMGLLERRHVDSEEKSQFRKCLDLLEGKIMTSKVISIVERLEVISRRLGLKFVNGPSGFDWFLSSDMFYLEVVLTPDGNVKKVKIHHDGSVQQEDCEELMMCLSRRDFIEFTEQLEGLISMYNLQAEKQIKSKAFLSLQCLKADIISLSEKSPFRDETSKMIYESHFGLVENEPGGHPMRLLYFIPPLELSDEAEKPLSFKHLPKSSYTLSITLQNSSSYALQTSSLLNFVDLDHESPQFLEITPSNSTLLPACFAMKLNEPMPICKEFIRKIISITGMDVNKFGEINQLISIIEKQVSEKYISYENNSTLVILPDQQHVYVLKENREMQGYLVRSIPFTHPGHIQKILPILRQQALFNMLITSCIKTNTEQAMKRMRESREAEIDETMEQSDEYYNFNADGDNTELDCNNFEVDYNFFEQLETDCNNFELDRKQTDSNNFELDHNTTDCNNFERGYKQTDCNNSEANHISFKNSKLDCILTPDEDDDSNDSSKLLGYDKLLKESLFKDEKYSGCVYGNDKYSVTSCNDVKDLLYPNNYNNELSSNCSVEFPDQMAFEIFLVSCHHISISFEHPVEETFVTVELQLHNVPEVQCKIEIAADVGDSCLFNIEECTALAFKRSFSIPATMRALLCSWETPNGDVEEEEEEEIENSHEISTNTNITDYLDENEILRAIDDDEEFILSGFDKNAHVKVDMIETTLDDFPPLPEDPEFVTNECLDLFTPDLIMGEYDSIADCNVFNSFEQFPIKSSSRLSSVFENNSNLFCSDISNNQTIFELHAPDSFGNSAQIVQPFEHTLLVTSSDDSSDSVLAASPKKSDMMATSSDICNTNDIPASNEFISVVADCDNFNFDMNHEDCLGANDFDCTEEFLNLKIELSGCVPSQSHNANDASVIKPSDSVVLPDADSKSLIPSSINITPISSSLLQISKDLGFKKRPVIAITPLATTSASPVPSSITITPVSVKEVDKSRDKSERKCKNKRSESKHFEKRKKRKHNRDSSPMCMPEKMQPKSDIFTKPVSVNIKQADSTLHSLSPTVSLRKYNISPTQGTSSTIANKLSPTSNSDGKLSNKYQMMGISPSAHLSSSKINNESSNTSPKHMAGAGSGKPSMSALKSADSTPSSSNKHGKNYKELSTRDHKEKKTSCNGSGTNENERCHSPKLKSSVKLRALDITVNDNIASGNVDGAIILFDNKCAPSLNIKNKKLSAVIDKIKSAKHGFDSSGEDSNTSCGNSQLGSGGNDSHIGGCKENKSNITTPNNEESKCNTASSKTASGEYMVKSSSEGIKITINKTRSKDNSNKSSTSKTTSSSLADSESLQHASLKLGVHGKPITKKFRQNVHGKSSTNNNNNLSSTSGSRGVDGGSSGSKYLYKSSGSVSSKPCKSSPKSGSDSAIYRKNKSRSSKAYPDKSSLGYLKRLSPTNAKDGADAPDCFKSQMQSGYPPLVGGLMKPLDTKFQIPKLSARFGNVSENDNSKKNGDHPIEMKFADASNKSESFICSKYSIGNFSDRSLNKSPKVSISCESSKKSYKATTEFVSAPSPGTENDDISVKMMNVVNNKDNIDLKRISQLATREKERRHCNESVIRGNIDNVSITNADKKKLKTDAAFYTTETVDLTSSPEGNEMSENRFISSHSSPSSSAYTVRRYNPLSTSMHHDSSTIALPSPKHNTKKSLVVLSPDSSSNSSFSYNSGHLSSCSDHRVTDDDLMDEALIGIGK